MSTIVVTGGSNGLGAAIIACMQGPLNYIYNVDRQPPLFAQNAEYVQADFLARNNIVDEVELACHHINDKSNGKVEILINCAGLNRIGWLEHFAEADWDDVMDVNAKSIFRMSQLLLDPLIATKGTILNIISNASHMPMTGSLAYNASKGAAHIMTLQLARELTKKYGITVFGISPNKMAGTEMSKYIEGRVPEVRGWTAEQTAAYQRQALLCGEETDPKVLAEFIGFLLYAKRNHKFLSGCVIPYGA